MSGAKRRAPTDRTEIQGIGQYLDEPDRVHEKIGRPVFGRSSNGGFWPKKVRNTLSFKARHSLRRNAVLPRTRSFEPTAKNEFRYKTVADSPAMLPLVTAQTVASERGVGGRIFAILRNAGSELNTSRIVTRACSIARRHTLSCETGNACFISL